MMNKRIKFRSIRDLATLQGGIDVFVINCPRIENQADCVTDSPGDDFAIMTRFNSEFQDNLRTFDGDMSFV